MADVKLARAHITLSPGIEKHGQFAFIGFVDVKELGLVNVALCFDMERNEIALVDSCGCRSGFHIAEIIGGLANVKLKSHPNSDPGAPNGTTTH